VSQQLDLADLWSTDADGVADLLAGAAPTRVVGALAEATDADLAALVAEPDVRRAVVCGLLDRLHEYALPGPLADLDGVLGLHLAHPGGTTRHRLAAHGGRLRHEVEDTVAGEVDVVLATDVALFLRLVAGARNAGLEYLAGRVDIVGDAALALAFGGIFRVPGTDDVAVDPTTLDPAEVSAALAAVTPGHLRSVMSSGFRPVVLDEIFRRLPEHLDDHKASRARLCVGFRLLGRPDGGVDRYVVRVAGGTATTMRVEDGADRADGNGADGSARDATITCDAADFLRLATGHLSAVSGVLRGQLKVRGDKGKALQLASVLSIPKAP